MSVLSGFKLPDNDGWRSGWSLTGQQHAGRIHVRAGEVGEAGRPSSERRAI